MLVIQQRHPRSSRPSLTCSVCGKLGYQYVRDKGSHRYVYTKHLDDPPIGLYRNGKPKFKECYKGGRLYNSIEEAIRAERIKIATKPHLTPKPKRKSRLGVPIIRRARANCPRCHKRGRLDRAPISSKTPDIKRFYIDHKRVNKKINRCYMRKGEETELAERIWSR